MKFIIIPSLLIHLLITIAHGKEICPRMCVCDIFEGLKRADCSDANLATAYTNVARSVEILNLSGNDITTIDNQCLAGFEDLKKLSLSRNSIHTIELFAFEQLDKLNFLDLSDNRLEEFDNRLLEACVKLTILDLSKNKFMNLPDRPLIISHNLEFLSLRNSHLSHVYDSHLSELPALVDLDLSNNLLITLVSSAFESLHHLQFINLEYNRFSCDFRIERTLQLFKERKVHVKIDKCVRNSKKPMFEKMIMHPDLTTEAPREDVDIDEVWGDETKSRKIGSDEHDDDDDDDEDSTHNSKVTLFNINMFHHYYKKIRNDHNVDEDDDVIDCDEDEFFPSTCECHQKYIQLYDMTEKIRKMQTKKLEFRIMAIFTFGIFVGAFVGYLFFFIISRVRKKCMKASDRQKQREHARAEIIALENIRLIHSPPTAPLPALRNQQQPHSNATTHDEEIRHTRSPVPTPRNQENRVTAVSNRGNYTNLPTITVHSLANSCNHDNNNDRPHSRRPIEATTSALNRSSSQRVSVENSPTARLIHKLFRNRDPSFLPGPSSSTTPLLARRSEHPTTTTVAEAVAPEIDNVNDTDDSEYHSMETLNLDGLRSVTPPPAYKSIFIEESTTDVVAK